jgi:hypothetical protein
MPEASQPGTSRCSRGRQLTAAAVTGIRRFRKSGSASEEAVAAGADETTGDDQEDPEEDRALDQHDDADHDQHHGDDP